MYMQISPEIRFFVCVKVYCHVSCIYVCRPPCGSAGDAPGGRADTAQRLHGAGAPQTQVHRLRNLPARHGSRQGQWRNLLQVVMHFYEANR